jgi:hypothetical protein
MTSSKIDSNAAPCTGQDDELRRAMMALRSPRKPSQAALKTQPGPKAKPKIRAKNAKQGKLESLQDAVLDEKFALSGQLTMKELRFIEFYLTGDLTVDKAMESAGYEGYHTKSLYRLGRKIVEKYESHSGDHRKIMRAMGYGEVKVIEMLIDSAENASSATVKLNARVALAKCLGLNNDVVQSNVGVNIIITGRSGASCEPVDGGGRPAQVHTAPSKALPKPVSIIK